MSFKETKKNCILISLDIEGPCALNDNSQETAAELAEVCGLGRQVGIDFFKRLSVIDDIWGDFHKIAKRPDYSSGYTLMVILAFYKAMGADYQWLYNFARQSLRVVPNIKRVISNLNRKYNVWMISTSYDFFVKAFSEKVGFDFSRIYCTPLLKFDEIPISRKESELLREFMKEVIRMPVIEYDKNTGQVVPEHQVYYDRITSFIWETVYHVPVGEFLRIVHPVGQAQKLEAMKEISRKLSLPKEKILYVGDSQTDLKCVEWLKGRGVGMMINGKGRVCELSDIMYIGEDAQAIEEIADLFAKAGRDGVINHYKSPRNAKCGGLLAAVRPDNIKELEEKSVKKRKEFRGVHIGELT